MDTAIDIIQGAAILSVVISSFVQANRITYLEQRMKDLEHEMLD